MGGAKAEMGPAQGRGAGNSATNSAQKQKEGADPSAKGGFGAGKAPETALSPGNRRDEPPPTEENCPAKRGYTMVNKVRVTIAGAPYAIATTDTEAYITSLAKKLDEDITKLLDDNGNLSLSKAAVFCAMDYLDEYRKSAGSAENMRSQIQDYIADAAKAKLAEDKVRAENEVLQRENNALREQLAKLQAKAKAAAAKEETAGERAPQA